MSTVVQIIAAVGATIVGCVWAVCWASVRIAQVGNRETGEGS